MVSTILYQVFYYVSILCGHCSIFMLLDWNLQALLVLADLIAGSGFAKLISRLFSFSNLH